MSLSKYQDLEAPAPKKVIIKFRTKIGKIVRGVFVSSDTFLQPAKSGCHSSKKRIKVMLRRKVLEGLPTCGQ